MSRKFDPEGNEVWEESYLGLAKSRMVLFAKANGYGDKIGEFNPKSVMSYCLTFLGDPLLRELVVGWIFINKYPKNVIQVNQEKINENYRKTLSTHLLDNESLFFDTLSDTQKAALIDYLFRFITCLIAKSNYTEENYSQFIYEYFNVITSSNACADSFEEFTEKFFSPLSESVKKRIDHALPMKGLDKVKMNAYMLDFRDYREDVINHIKKLYYAGA